MMSHDGEYIINSVSVSAYDVYSPDPVQYFVGYV